MGFINDNTAPLYGVKFRTAPQNHLKRGDNSLESVSTPQHTALRKKKNKWKFFICLLIIRNSGFFLKIEEYKKYLNAKILTDPSTTSRYFFK